MSWQISIQRFNPEKDLKPYMQTYNIEPDAVRGEMLLDLIHAVKRQDPTVSIRRSCGEGVCGSDGMNINGRNGLACITKLASFTDTPIVLRPLPAMPIIRDLIVDMDQFFKQYERVKPYLQNSGPIPSGEHLQSPKDRDKLDGLYECILCGCCTSSCPSWWWNPDKFLGPAAALQAARFVLDSRDDTTQERLADLEDAYKIFRCRSILNCAEVCPKDLNPSAAIGDLRDKLLQQDI